jgi:dUTP pyrophosphatase
MNLLMKKLHKDAIKPQRGTELASGFDLCALDVIQTSDVGKVPYLDLFDQYVVQPHERVLVRTGVAVQLDYNMEAQVRPRSGLGLKKGIHVMLGTIDADYTGDIGVVLTNLGNEPFVISKGDRIAQLVFAPVLHEVKLLETQKFAKVVDRGGNGFGSTGV